MVPLNTTAAILLFPPISRWISCQLTHQSCNPQEHIRDEIRENIFRNYAAKSMDEVCDKLEETEELADQPDAIELTMAAYLADHA
jgi:hypothetical protein